MSDNEMQESTITYKGEEYPVSKLSEQSKYLIKQVADLEQKINKLIFEREQLSAARTHFQDLLESSLKNDVEEEKEDAA